MSITIPGGTIETSGFQHCCGLNIFYGFTSNVYHDRPTVMPNIYDKQEMEKVFKGVSLIALTHLQWKNEELLKYISSIGYEPIIEDFHNANSGHQITLFAKIHNKKAQGISAAWKEAKKFFQKESE